MSVYFVKKLYQILRLYIEDGGDASVPSISSFIFIFLFMVIGVIYILYKGYFDSSLALLINLVWITLLVMISQGRLLSYPTINMSSYKKVIILGVINLVYISCFVILLALYDSTLNYTYFGFNIYDFTHMLYFVLEITPTPGIRMPIIFGISCFIINIFILYFDILEKKRIENTVEDILLFLPTIIYTITGIIGNYYSLFEQPIVILLFYITTLCMIFYNIRNETNQIIYRTTRINTLVRSTKKLLNSMINKKEYTKNDISRFNLILSILREDEEVRESIFATKNFFNKKKFKLIERLKEVYYHPEKNTFKTSSLR
jgi:hypothetical protein